MKYSLYLPVAMLLGTFLFFGTACGGDDEMEPMVPEENTAIPVTIVRLVISGGTQGSQTFSYREVPPPEVGVVLPPEVDDIVLEANTSYSYRIIAQSETSNGTRNVNDDIEEDGEDYLFTFDVLAVNLDLTPTDEDQFGAPIGLSGTLQTGDVSSGVLMFKLFFETNKSSPGGSGERIISGDFRVELN